MNEEKLNTFMGQMLSDLGGAFSIGLVRAGAKLGLYKTLHECGPMSSTELANATNCAERYIREWASAQAASNYIAYDSTSQKFSIPPEQAAVFADEDSPVYMVAAFDSAAAYLESQDKIEHAFQTGGGVAWGDQAGCLFCAVARFFRPGYKANLIESWIPALDGVVNKLKSGAKIADVGCGHGYSTVLMAEAFPDCEIIGYDFHPDSIAEATKHAQEHGVDDRCKFEVGGSTDYPGKDFDLVTFFDCLHDMGDPAGASAHVRQSLKPDG
ncbi:MAG: class I SAM-dependent methyltransferase, partial [Pseudomonadota bacterium]